MGKKPNGEERAKLAQEHTENMAKNYAIDIENCLAESTVYSASIKMTNMKSSIRENEETKVLLQDKDTVRALFDLVSEEKFGRIAILNFASYNNPGGGFIRGSLAQEEALCHESILYNVLSNKCFQESFYGPNHRNSNKGLYDDNLIYSKDVLFEKDGIRKYADVITCAAPNAKVARNNLISETEITEAMRSRIQHILNAAAINKAETLILGAFGCGVFGNHPTTVARLFEEEISETFNHHFKYVIYAIPNSRNANFEEFKSVMFPR